MIDLNTKLSSLSYTANTVDELDVFLRDTYCLARSSLQCELIKEGGASKAYVVNCGKDYRR